MAYNMKEIWASKTNYGAYRALCSIGYITIHFTSNDGDTAENNGKYFQGENRKSSAHYFVDDTTVVHSVPDDRMHGLLVEESTTMAVVDCTERPKMQTL